MRLLTALFELSLFSSLLHPFLISLFLSLPFSPIHPSLSSLSLSLVSIPHSLSSPPLSLLVQGVNVESIDLICNTMKLVSFEEALICINDPDLHPLLQSAYLDFVTSAYVESNVEESGVDVDNIWHSFVSQCMYI